MEALHPPVVQAAHRPPRWVTRAQVFLVAAVALSIPGGVLAAFGFGVNRNLTGDTVAVLFLVAFVLLLSTPWWLSSAQPKRSNLQRLESTCLIWFGLTFTTHLTWELGWLLFRDRIIDSPNAPWAFVWWMYIDGGDRRYASPGSLILTVELLSVLNGLMGFGGLWLRRRTRGASATATLLLMATAVVHVYSALLYLFTEMFGGYPNVDTASFVDLWVKFGMLNGLWVAMPVVVMKWGVQTLNGQLARAPPSFGARDRT